MNSVLLKTAEIEDVIRGEGFAKFAVTRLRQPLSIEFYEEWLAGGFQGEMDYLVRHLPKKRDPAKLMDRARSAIVLLKNYVPQPHPLSEWPLSSDTKVAAYAHGRDYHHVFKHKLTRVIEVLKARWPQEEFRAFSDSSPVLERDLARQAGLGWVGKNTCLLSRDSGSLFLIAEIYTTMESAAAELESADHCGTCTRCLDACPTGALTSPRRLDARKCISYLTIESRQVPEEGLREKIGDWLFGCDICQNVCPWNIKLHGSILQPGSTAKAPATETAGRRENLLKDLRYILSSSNRSLEKAFASTPLSRAGGFGLKRNALIVAANRGCHELRAEIQGFLPHEKLGELARWTLSRLDQAGGDVNKT